MADVRELTIEGRVRRILGFLPALSAHDVRIIALTVALARGGTPASDRIEQLAGDIDELREQQAVLRERHTALREELETVLAGLETV